MKKGHESMVERTEMRMVRWMCGTSLREKKRSAESRDKMGLDSGVTWPLDKTSRWARSHESQPLLHGGRWRYGEKKEDLENA